MIVRPSRMGCVLGLLCLALGGCTHDHFEHEFPMSHDRFRTLRDATIVREGNPSYLALIPNGREGSDEHVVGHVQKGTVFRVEKGLSDQIDEFPWTHQSLKTFGRIVTGPFTGTLVETSEAAGVSIDWEFGDARVVERVIGDAATRPGQP